MHLLNQHCDATFGMYSSTTERTSVVRDIVATDKTNQLSKLVVSSSTINNSVGRTRDNAKTSKDKFTTATMTKRRRLKTA
ncbi:hypothetical protein T09_3978 [Trichinella sp. T9]|nr:hypothetical protein T09_3978 [Trichinella sp. T9]